MSLILSAAGDFFGVAVAVFVVLGIVSNIFSAAKKQKMRQQNGQSSPNNNTSAESSSKSYDEVMREVMAERERRESANLAEAEKARKLRLEKAEMLKKEKLQNERAAVFDSSKNSDSFEVLEDLDGVEDEKIKAYYEKQRQEDKRQAPASSMVRIDLERKDLHKHPSESSKGKIEKVAVGGSAGGAITEGCVEHYDERFVLEDETIEKGPAFADSLDNEFLEKCIVFGDIINSPVSRKFGHNNVWKK